MDFAELERQISAARYAEQSASAALDRSSLSNVEKRNVRARYHRAADRAWTLYRHYKAAGGKKNIEDITPFFEGKWLEGVPSATVEAING